ncbi:MAG TPA: LysM peptidoglycan-binding domain-containing protein [Chryseosolibacter sp.]
MKIFAALFFAAALPAVAQKVEVPHKLEFAGITLVIRDDARREIQKDVDALTASPRHYQIKVERAKTYFPLIEKVFREEGIPEDFKYLALQESALIPDAVSTSNAVGFWQFKDYTAIEMGLRVDREIDERLNIVSSSRAAARYLIKNNQFFDNWLYALQAYQMGAGGVMKSVPDTEAKATRMEITGKTYWYVKRFLAHKIAYEGSVKGTPKQQVVVFENNGPTNLKKLAQEIQVDEQALTELNKWAKGGVIPGDRRYVVLLPVEGGSLPDVAILQASNRVEEERIPAVSRAATPSGTGKGRKINGIHTVQALSGEDAHQLAARAGVDVSDFLKWNDLSGNDRIRAGQLYFVARKRLKGSGDFHKVAPGETLWAISQQYGIQVKRLRRYNRLEEGVDPAAGTMLYLASKRPKADPVIAKVDNPVEVNDTETFSWSVSPATSSTSVAEKTDLQDPLPLNHIVSSEAAKGADSLKILQPNETNATLDDTAAVVFSPLPPDMMHSVKAGETLYGIAKLYNLTVMELVSTNGLNLQEGIHPGQVLRLSSAKSSDSQNLPPKDGKTTENEELVHEVKTSDTLYSIARQYNVTIKEIMEWNEKKDFSLSVGEKLKILRGQ